MTEIKIIRGAQKSPIVLGNGDKYDSTAEYTKNDKYYKFDHINTDYSNKYGRGGILKPGRYAAICSLRDSGLKAFWLFDMAYIDRVNSRADITVSMATLPSIVPNANQGGQNVMQWILIHKGGYNTDGSAGCLTIYPNEYSAFFKNFEIGEKAIVWLV